MARWGGPRKIVVHRDPDRNFGFTLRHFIVYPPHLQSEQRGFERALFGIRAGSGCEPMDTIFVKQVKTGSAAEQSGLREGDRLLSVNEQNITGRPYAQVVSLIQQSEGPLRLLVVPKDEDVLQVAYGSSAYSPPSGSVSVSSSRASASEKLSFSSRAPSRFAYGEPRSESFRQGGVLSSPSSGVSTDSVSDRRACRSLRMGATGFSNFHRTMDAQGPEYENILSYVRNLVPESYYRHAVSCDDVARGLSSDYGSSESLHSVRSDSRGQPYLRRLSKITETAHERPASELAPWGKMRTRMDPLGEQEQPPHRTASSTSLVEQRLNELKHTLVQSMPASSTHEPVFIPAASKFNDEWHRLMNSSLIETVAERAAHFEKVDPKNFHKKKNFLLGQTDQTALLHLLAHRKASEPTERAADTHALELMGAAGGKDKPSWRGRVVKSLKRFGSHVLHRPSMEPSLSIPPVCEEIHSAPLESCEPSSISKNVPLVIEVCARVVEARGLHMVGVYRVPGNSAAVNAMMKALDEGVEGAMASDKWADIPVVTSVMKAYLRRLREPLVPAEFYQRFIDASRMEDHRQRLVTVKRLVYQLPVFHLETLKFLGSHLRRIAAAADRNKMDPRNLAIVFGPTLMRQNSEDMTSLIADMSDQCRVVETLVVYYDWIFDNPDFFERIPDEVNLEYPSIGIEPEKSVFAEIDPQTLVSGIVKAAKRRWSAYRQSSESLVEGGEGAFAGSRRTQDHQHQPPTAFRDSLRAAREAFFQAPPPPPQQVPRWPTWMTRESPTNSDSSAVASSPRLFRAPAEALKDGRHLRMDAVISSHNFGSQ